MNNEAPLCLCGHRYELHVLGKHECQATVPTHCQCKAWMRAVENAGKMHICRCGHDVDDHHGSYCSALLSSTVSCECPGFVAGLTIEMTGEPVHDPVSRPAHYNWIPGGVQPIDIAEHLPYNLGAAVKYIVRAGRKGDAAEDLRKAAWHVNRELERMGKVKP